MRGKTRKDHDSTTRKRRRGKNSAGARHRDGTHNIEGGSQGNSKTRDEKGLRDLDLQVFQQVRVSLVGDVAVHVVAGQPHDR